MVIRRRPILTRCRRLRANIFETTSSRPLSLIRLCLCRLSFASVLVPAPIHCGLTLILRPFSQSSRIRRFCQTRNRWTCWYRLPSSPSGRICCWLSFRRCQRVMLSRRLLMSLVFPLSGPRQLHLQLQLFCRRLDHHRPILCLACLRRLHPFRNFLPRQKLPDQQGASRLLRRIALPADRPTLQQGNLYRPCWNRRRAQQVSLRYNQRRVQLQLRSFPHLMLMPLPCLRRQTYQRLKRRS